MSVCFPCHFRCFIAAKCPWKKSLEYQCSLLWERPTLSLNCSSAQDTQVRDLMAVLRENSLYCQASKSSPVQRGKKKKREKKAHCQTACSQTANNEAMHNKFLMQLVFYPDIIGWDLFYCNTLKQIVSSVNPQTKLQTKTGRWYL